MNVKAEGIKQIKRSLEIISPKNLVYNHLKSYPIQNKVKCLAIGKAAYEMSIGAMLALNEQMDDCLIITKYGHTTSDIDTRVKIIEAAHPIVDENSLKAGKQAIDFLNNVNDDQEVLFLLSGGGSSLCECLKDGVTYKDYKQLNDCLMKVGAPIQEINAIRRVFSNIKGGELLYNSGIKRYQTLVISDIPNGNIQDIASGPTSNSYVKKEWIYNIINRYQITMNDAMKKMIDVYQPITNLKENIHLLSDNAMFCNILKEQIIKDEVDCEIVGCGLEGDINFFKNLVVDKIEYQFTKPCNKHKVFLIGNEMTIKINGNGKGGRCQQFALEMAAYLQRKTNVSIFAFGSDGSDGPTDATGAYVDSNTFDNIMKLGLDIQTYIANNDAYTILDKVDALLFSGPTGTNVNDVIMIYIQAKNE